MRAVIIKPKTWLSKGGRSKHKSKKVGAVFINAKIGAEAPIFKIVFQLLLSIHEVAKDKFFNAVADGIHTTGVFHFVAAFEVFRDAFKLCVLTDQ